MATQKFQLLVLNLVRAARTVDQDKLKAPSARAVEDILLTENLDAEQMLRRVVETVLDLPF